MAAGSEEIPALARPNRGVARRPAQVPGRARLRPGPGVPARGRGQLPPVHGARRDRHGRSVHGHVFGDRHAVGPPVRILERDPGRPGAAPGDHDRPHARRGHGGRTPGRVDLRGGADRGLPSRERPRGAARVPRDRADRRGVRGARDRDRIDHQGNAGFPDGDELPRDAHLLSLRRHLPAAGAPARARRAHADRSAHLRRGRRARPADRVGVLRRGPRPRGVVRRRGPVRRRRSVAVFENRGLMLALQTPLPAIVYTTAESTSFRLTATDTLVFKPSEPTSEGKVYVFVDPRKTFQPVIGIGGALTDAAAETFAKLPAARQDEVIAAYYGSDRGIGYTLGRTNINSCDFPSESYTYVTEGDSALTSFSIAHDLRYKVPLIKRAMAASGNRLKLFASPWSPPAFMKDNNDMLHGGHLRPEYGHSWALYFAKFIQSYRQAGVPVWGITIQNEPMATQRWESCVFQARDERDFLKDHLGPVMAQQGLRDVNIIVWDHNRDLIIQRAQTIFDDPDAAKYVWGIGFHWYEDWSGGQQMYGNVALVNRLYPDKHILFTEGTPASFDSTGYGRWSLGEAYGRSMINDFNSGTEGWTDWNILLDERGGPNHVGNFCFAPIHADTRTGTLIYTNSYYYIGHFSKFIRPGARRILASPSRSMLLTTAFVNRDGKVVVVVMNPTAKGGPYNLTVGTASVQISSRPHSIQTVVFSR